MRQKNVRRELAAQNIERGDRKPFSKQPYPNFLEKNFHLIKIVANESLFIVQALSVRPRVWAAHRQNDDTPSPREQKRLEIHYGCY